jgi:DNA-binding transcriptional MerR regulator
LDQRLYRTGQFAQKAAVSIRTVRYYDRVGLLPPSHHTEAGYRLYTAADFLRLQQILALKFLGFSLAEIRACLQVGPTALTESLALQKAMMREKRGQLDAIMRTIDETEKLLRTTGHDWEAIVNLIQVMQMEQTNDWRKKYFTEAQLQEMEELSKASYTEEQRKKLAEWGKGWSEEDQRVASQQWDAVIAELKRLVATGQDPAGAEAQALVARWSDLIQQFTHGDPGIAQGLNNLYRRLAAMPAAARPYPMPYNQEEETFLREALAIQRQKQGQ